MRRLISASASGLGVLMAGAGLSVAVPPSPAPQSSPPGFIGPPAAWIETQSGDYWLTPRFDQWCAPELDGRCVIVTPALGLGGACLSRVFGPEPEVRVTPSERLRFHLGLPVRAAVVTTERRPDSPVEASQQIEWQAPAEAFAGSVSLVAVFDGGRATYRLRVVVGTDVLNPEIRSLTVRRDGTRAVLSFRLSEPSLVTGCIEPAGSAATTPLAPFRRLPAVTLNSGSQRLVIGSGSLGGFRVRLLVRDRAGNSTVVVRRVGAARVG